MARLMLKKDKEMAEYLKSSGFDERQVRGLMRAVKDALSELDLPTRKDWDKLDQRTQKLYDGFENFRKTFHARLEKALADAKKDLKQDVEDDLKEDAKEREKKAEDHNKERYDNLLRHIESLQDTAKDLRGRWIRDMDALRGEVGRSDKESKERDGESKDRDGKLEQGITDARQESKERDEKLERDIAAARKESKEGDDESKKRDERAERRNERRHDQLLQEMTLTREILQAQREGVIGRQILFWGRWLLRRFKILRNLWAHIKS